MREKDPHFARAIDEIEKGIEQFLQQVLNSKKGLPKQSGIPSNKKDSK